MKTEISRNSHQSKKRYSAVYQQQGRMLSDADWNELVDVLNEQLDDALKDIVGTVDEKSESSRGGVPRHRALKVTQQTSGDQVMIAPGHIYVDGMAAEVVADGPIALDAQTDFPFDTALPAPAGGYFLYADVWERTVTAIEDQRLLDPALHGADTCTRKQAMAQIKWCIEHLDKPPPTKGNSRLAVRLREEATVDDPCDPCAAEVEVDSKVGNYLFRMEVHDVQYRNGKPEDGIDQLKLKWSSENGAEQYQRIDSENEGLPQAFTEGDWVFEYYNEVTEKHLGVHLPGGVVAVRGVLRTGFTTTPTPSVNDYPFVRRWDGYCTLSWNSASQVWVVSEAWSRGTDLYPPEIAARRIKEITGGKRFTLKELLLELQLHTIVTGDAVTDDSLSGTDLEINGAAVVSAGGSADAKVTAINGISGTTHVIATAITVAEGMPPVSEGDIADGELIINGINIGAVSAGADKQAQADAVVNAINTNATFDTDAAFAASKTAGGAIVLTTADGRDIVVEVASADVSNRCGFAGGTTTFRGSISLISLLNSDIVISGTNPEYTGFSVGTTPAIQFVAGDFWLAEVRDTVLRSELEKLREAQNNNASYEIPPILEPDVPQGIEHHYFKLGIVEGGELKHNQEKDRKYAFPPLTEMTRMFHVAGDGQEAMPGDRVPQPLIVGVANGEWPVEGAKVAFYVNHGGGTIVEAPEHPISGNSSTIADGETSSNIGGFIITTDDNGIARCAWQLGPLGSGKQQVIAWLVDPERDGPDRNDSSIIYPRSSADFLLHPPIRFYANLSTADQLAYEPGCNPGSDTLHNLLVNDAATPPNLPALGSDGYYTVKDILDAFLCKLKATHIPVDRGDLCTKLESLTGDERVNTVQDAMNALCRMERGGSCCTITISPGDDLEAMISVIPDNGDAHICITRGHYKVKGPVILRNKGHITLQGCGMGSRVFAPNSESVFIFERCKSIVVRNIAIQSGAIGEKGGYQSLSGSLSVYDVQKVTVEDATLICPAGGRRMASCLTVAYGTTAYKMSSVRIRHCQLYPGQQQVGILLINTHRAQIEDNEIRGRPKPKGFVFKKRLKQKYYRLSIRKMLVSNAVVVERTISMGSTRNVELTYGRQRLQFLTDTNLIEVWQRYWKKNKPASGLTPREVIRALKKMADTILLNPVSSPNGFKIWYEQMQSHLPAIAAQGIVCAGRVAKDIRILNNSIHGVAQGIHIGLSDHQLESKMPYIAGRLRVTGNHVVIYLSSQVYGNRHGIYVGNFESLDVEDNYMKVERFPRDIKQSIQGIRVFGHFGRMMQIRCNHLYGFDTGVFARAITPLPPGQDLWQIESNMFTGASKEVDVYPPGNFLIGANRS